MSDVIFRRFIPIGTTEDMDKFTALLVEKNITRDDLLLILRSVKLNPGVFDEEGDDCVYQVRTHPRVAEFAHKFRFPGWYIDSNGCYGCMLGKYWISVFVNDCDEALDITVDTVGETGHFDKNLEWKTAESDDELALTAMRFMAQYDTKGA